MASNKSLIIYEKSCLLFNSKLSDLEKKTSSRFLKTLCSIYFTKELNLGYCVLQRKYRPLSFCTTFLQNKLLLEKNVADIFSQWNDEPISKKNTGRELLACGASSAAVLSMLYSVTGNTCKMFFCQLTILTGKNCYTEFSIGIVAWLLLTFFLYLHNQLSSIHSIITC